MIETSSKNAKRNFKVKKNTKNLLQTYFVSKKKSHARDFLTFLSIDFSQSICFKSKIVKTPLSIQFKLNYLVIQILYV